LLTLLEKCESISVQTFNIHFFYMDTFDVTKNEEESSHRNTEFK